MRVTGSKEFAGERSRTPLVTVPGSTRKRHVPKDPAIYLPQGGSEKAKNSKLADTAKFSMKRPLTGVDEESHLVRYRHQPKVDQTLPQFFTKHLE